MKIYISKEYFDKNKKSAGLSIYAGDIINNEVEIESLSIIFKELIKFYDKNESIKELPGLIISPRKELLDLSGSFSLQNELKIQFETQEIEYVNNLTKDILDLEKFTWVAIDSKYCNSEKLAKIEEDLNTLLSSKYFGHPDSSIKLCVIKF